MSYNMTQYDEPFTSGDTMISFNPHDYIEVIGDGFARCHNPFADAGLSEITVNTKLFGDTKRNFESSVKRMVLSKLFSPKFGEIILAAMRPQGE